jgi:hypothetical protein
MLVTFQIVEKLPGSALIGEPGVTAIGALYYAPHSKVLCDRFELVIFRKCKVAIKKPSPRLKQPVRDAQNL